MVGYTIKMKTVFIKPPQIARFRNPHVKFEILYLYLLKTTKYQNG